LTPLKTIPRTVTWLDSIEKLLSTSSTQIYVPPTPHHQLKFFFPCLKLWLLYKE